MVDVVVGQVTRAHGIQGDVVVVPHTDEPQRRFAATAVLTLEGLNRRLAVKSTRRQRDHLIVRFDGVTTRDEAEALVGGVLSAAVPVAERPDDDAEYYDRQLVGLVAQAPDGHRLGQVSDVIHGPAQDLLVIRTDTGERLVPFVGSLVPVVDLAAGYLTLADLPGLLDDGGDV